MKLSGKKYQRLWRNIGLILLEAFLCLSLMLTGSLFWVNNIFAVIPNNDPTTMIEMSQLLGGSPGIGGLDGSMPAKLVLPPGDSVIPVAGGTLVRGNGGQDDNKEEPFIFKDVSEEIIRRQTYNKAVTSFQERRTVAAYKDFGHLKVMPAAETINVTNNWTFYRSKAVRVLRAAFNFYLILPVARTAVPYFC